jgi:hypothetical protein
VTQPLATFDARPGEVWLCAACGKESPNRAEGPKGWDESCFLHAVLVETSSLKRNTSGRVIEARAVTRMGVSGGRPTE